MPKINMNRNTIKYIAIIAMLIDHIAAFIIGPNNFIYYPMRIIGRITAPIMCFFLAEGYKHTRSKLKYGIRLFVFAIISQIPYSLASEGKTFVSSFNIIFTLFLSFLMLLSYEKIKDNFLKWVIVSTIIFLTIICDGAIVAPILVLMFYKISDLNKMEKYYILIVIIDIMFLTLFSLIIKQSTWYLNFIQLGKLLALPLLKLYNGEAGKKNICNKWFFYAFYPLHLLLIYIIEINL